MRCCKTRNMGICKKKARTASIKQTKHVQYKYNSDQNVDCSRSPGEYQADSHFDLSFRPSMVQKKSDLQLAVGNLHSVMRI
jgi:hypothetical protein